jgi:hypothetical protein
MAFHLEIALVLPDTPSKGVHRKMVYNLRKDDLACVHWAAPPLDVVRAA